MKCKARWCDLESGHHGKCRRVANVVANANIDSRASGVVETVGAAISEAARVQRWRESSRERYNKRQRELMRRKRAGVF